VNKNQDLDDTNLSKAEHCKNTRFVLKMRGKKKKDMDDVLSLQKANAKICSNATALVDEAEEELGKIDGWLVRRPPHCNSLQHTATRCNTLQHKRVFVHRG